MQLRHLWGGRLNHFSEWRIAQCDQTRGLNWADVLAQLHQFAVIAVAGVADTGRR